MGALVGILTNAFLASSSSATKAQDKSEQRRGTGQRFNSRIQLEFEEEQYATIKSNLHQLVALRNELVHNFLTKFNLENAKSRIEAEEFLKSSYIAIDSHYNVLCGWASSMFHAQNLLAEALKNSQARDRIFNGIFDDNPVRWKVSGIVQGLRDAEAELASNSWVSLSAAIAWMGQNAPQEKPKHYGCRSWRQVLHESGQFEVRRQKDGAITKAQPAVDVLVWYRSRRRSVRNLP